MPWLLVCRDSIAKEMIASMTLIQQQAVKVEWTKVFKASFMLLFIAYPGTVWATDSVTPVLHRPRIICLIDTNHHDGVLRHHRRGTEDHAHVPMHTRGGAVLAGC